ncbi:MAG: hypothetical protein WD845_05445 [Pirellulales bacterium]
MVVVVVGLIVSLSVLVGLPDPRSESVAFDNSMQSFAARGAAGIVLLIAGQALQRPTGADPQARLSRLIASDYARVASRTVVCPNQPSDRQRAIPTLQKTPPRPHTHGRARKTV